MHGRKYLILWCTGCVISSTGVFAPLISQGIKFGAYFDDDNINSLYWFTEAEKDNLLHIVELSPFFYFGCATCFPQLQPFVSMLAISRQ